MHGSALTGAFSHGRHLGVGNRGLTPSCHDQVGLRPLKHLDLEPGRLVGFKGALAASLCTVQRASQRRES